MKVTLGDLAEHITDSAAKYLKETTISKKELVVHTTPEQLLQLLSFLQSDANCLFKVLVDITAVDYPEREKRFEVVYNLLSVKWNRRVRVKLSVDEDTPVPSAVQLFASAGWHERETFDMYGVFFNGNPDLRRILTDYGFDGHPLRKDFPLTGYVELRYDEEQKRVVYEPVELRQEFRNFDFLSPWEGPEKYVLPGDEKAGEKK
jgi:NADH-quinone oxidoreductase subunit C